MATKRNSTGSGIETFDSRPAASAARQRIMGASLAAGGRSVRVPLRALAILCCGVSALLPQAHGAQSPADPAAASAGRASPTQRVLPQRSLRTPTRAKDYFLSIWGVDNFLVRRTASTNLVRFSYRVVDPARAEALGDAHIAPQLVASARGVALQVPSMEQVGDLRQKGKPEVGKEYWMVFSNKGNLVKPGDRVSVVIGSFHADGLVVQ